MTPSQYAAKFLDLRVYMPLLDNDGAPMTGTSMYLPDASKPGKVGGLPLGPGQWKRYEVKGYRLTASGQQFPLLKAVKNSAFLHLRVQQVDGVITDFQATPEELRFSLMAAFRGKGYPEDVQVALQLWARHGIDSPGVDQLVNSAGVGLDCNGFVGGYMERRDAPGRWRRTKDTKTDYYIRDLLGPSGKWLGRWDDFAPRAGQSLLLGLCKDDGTLMDHDPADPRIVGHIAITEPGTLASASASGPVSVEALESTGGVGLTRSTYNVLSMTRDGAGRGIFRVQRGSKIGTRYEYAHFRIAPLA